MLLTAAQALALSTIIEEVQDNDDYHRAVTAFDLERTEDNPVQIGTAKTVTNIYTDILVTPFPQERGRGGSTVRISTDGMISPG